jgi:DNA mismatch endonuclease (patch repair protein)
MADVVSPEVRSRMMSGIRGKDTKPEMIIRRGLHARGFRFRLHDRTLPGKPDLVFPKYRAVIFVHGCFWHGHECHLFKWPKTRVEFWREKIEGNRARDVRVALELRGSGWDVIEVWECQLKDKRPHELERVLVVLEGRLKARRPLAGQNGANNG